MFFFYFLFCCVFVLHVINYLYRLTTKSGLPDSTLFFPPARVATNLGLDLFRHSIHAVRCCIPLTSIAMGAGRRFCSLRCATTEFLVGTSLSLSWTEKKMLLCFFTFHLSLPQYCERLFLGFVGKIQEAL